MEDSTRHRTFIIVCIGSIGILCLGFLSVGVLVTYTRFLAAAPTPTPEATGTLPPTALPTASLVTPLISPTPQPTASLPLTPLVSPTPLPSPTARPEATATALPTRRIEVNYPREMVVGEAGEVTVQIMVPPELAAVGMAHVPGAVVIHRTVPDRPRDTIRDAIQVYPVMWAELIAPNFDITADDANPRRAVAGMPFCVWTWHLLPRNPGSQIATIKIFAEVSVESQKVSVQVKDYTFDIKVLDRPLAGKIANYVLDNLFAILGTGGPLGLILLYLKYRGDQENKRLKARIGALQERVEEVQGQEKPT